MNTTHPSLFVSLKHIALQHRRRLAATFTLVVLENLLFVLYPLFGSFAVNAVLQGQAHAAVLYGLMVAVIWTVGGARRVVDTRAFARMYAELAVPVILAERTRGTDDSAIAARVVLSRELIDFFERDLPEFFTACASVIGSVIMLLVLEPWAGVMTLVTLAAFLLIVPRLTRTNTLLHGKLNDRLEKEVALITDAPARLLGKHFALNARLRIRISNREAAGYVSIGLWMSAVFAAVLALLAGKHTDAGHIYAVLTYLWAFAMSLDSAPFLIEQYAKLTDIGARVDVRHPDNAP